MVVYLINVHCHEFCTGVICSALHIFMSLQGAQGQRGPVGPAGADGNPGDRGDPGSSGAKGDSGAKVEYYSKFPI